MGEICETCGDFYELLTDVRVLNTLTTHYEDTGRCGYAVGVVTSTGIGAVPCVEARRETDLTLIRPGTRNRKPNITNEIGAFEGETRTWRKPQVRKTSRQT